MGGNAIPVTEPMPITTTVVDGIHDIEIKGHQAIFTFYEDQRCAVDKSIERKIVARFAVQTDNVPTMIRQASAALLDEVVDGFVDKAKAVLAFN